VRSYILCTSSYFLRTCFVKVTCHICGWIFHLHIWQIKLETDKSEGRKCGPHFYFFFFLAGLEVFFAGFFFAEDFADFVFLAGFAFLSPVFFEATTFFLPSFFFAVFSSAFFIWIYLS